MVRKRYGVEEIIQKLREAEVLLSQGQTVQQVARMLEISEQTYYRWRKEYGGMDKSQAQRLKELERENARLRHIVADLTLDDVDWRTLTLRLRQTKQRRERLLPLPSSVAQALATMRLATWPVTTWAGPADVAAPTGSPRCGNSPFLTQVVSTPATVGTRLRTSPTASRFCCRSRIESSSWRIRSSLIRIDCSR